MGITGEGHPRHLAKGIDGVVFEGPAICVERRKLIRRDFRDWPRMRVDELCDMKNAPSETMSLFSDRRDAMKELRERPAEWDEQHQHAPAVKRGRRCAS